MMTVCEGVFAIMLLLYYAIALLRYCSITPLLYYAITIIFIIDLVYVH